MNSANVEEFIVTETNSLTVIFFTTSGSWRNNSITKASRKYTSISSCSLVISLTYLQSPIRFKMFVKTSFSADCKTAEHCSTERALEEKSEGNMPRLIRKHNSLKIIIIIILDHF